MLTVSTFTRGLRNGLRITWELGVVIVPVYIAVTILKYTPALNWIAELMKPVMHIVGLPGEASLPLVLGAFLNIYAAIGAVLPLAMNTKEITIIAAMLLLAHSLPLEGIVSKKSGAKVSTLIITRLISAFGAGLLFNYFL
ncbi:MAG: nucleoside recognition protein [Syntrophomonadaceae bacterium]|nr:nucleoside recognition protein [Syntrophomonadaceae bacterium]